MTPCQAIEKQLPHLSNMWWTHTSGCKQTAFVPKYEGILFAFGVGRWEPPFFGTRGYCNATL